MSRIYQALKRAEEEGRALARLAPPPAAPPPASAEQLVVLSDPQSAAAEEYRKLRTRLLRRSRPPKTILVTSPLPQEGKTVTAANLAVAIAQGVEEHVLLVDADLRRPALHRLFELDNHRGLADHLAEGVALPELLRRMEHLPKLSLLTGGPPRRDSAELLTSERMQALVREIGSRYPDRYVVLDSPPLLLSAETQALSRYVDGVVLVVRAQRTPREALRESLELLRAGEASVLGLVFNQAPPSAPGYDYRYRYYHRYYSRHGET